MFVSSLFSIIFVNDMLCIWFLMEINLFSFFSYGFSKNFKNEILMIYFMIQIFSSLILIFYLLINFIYSEIIFSLSMSIKLGLMPYSIWYFFLEKINFFLLFLILTFKKIFYLVLISKQTILKNFFLLVFITSFIVILNMTQLKIKSIIIISSMFHTSWMLLNISMSKFTTMFYFYCYLLSNFWFFFSILKKNSVLVNFSMKSFNQMLIILSISSIPPFLMFFPKLILIMNLNILNLLIFVLLICTLINIFVYSRILTFFFLTSKKMLKTDFNLKLIMILLLNLLMAMIF